MPLKEGSKKLLTPSWAVAKANELATASKLKIQQLGVGVYGDINSLDNASVPEGELEYSSTIDIETVAQAMLGFDKSLAQRIPFRWIFTRTTVSINRRLMGVIKLIFPGR